MGIAKKKPILRIKGEVAETVIDPRVEACHRLIESTHLHVVHMLELEDVAKVATISEDIACPQALLELYMCVHMAQTLLSNAQDILADSIKAHRKAPGGFEPGSFDVRFNDTSKTNPKWKDESVGHATELANIKGVPFVEAAYLARIKAKYPASTSTSIVVTRKTLVEG